MEIYAFRGRGKYGRPIKLETSEMSRELSDVIARDLFGAHRENIAVFR